jgi:hypothetical protein
MGPRGVVACCGLVLVRAQAGVPVPLEALFELGEAVEKLLVLDDSLGEGGS